MDITRNNLEHLIFLLSLRVAKTTKMSTWGGRLLIYLIAFSVYVCKIKIYVYTWIYLAYSNM